MLIPEQPDTLTIYTHTCTHTHMHMHACTHTNTRTQLTDEFYVIYLTANGLSPGGSGYYACT
jgi:hypothetical protein